MTNPPEQIFQLTPEKGGESNPYHTMPRPTAEYLKRLFESGNNLEINRDSINAFLALLQSPEKLNATDVIAMLEQCSANTSSENAESPIKILNDYDLGLQRPQRQREILEAGITLFEDNYLDLLDNPIARQVARLAFFQEISKPLTVALEGSNKKALVQHDSRMIYNRLFKYCSDNIAVKIAALFLALESDLIGARIWYGNENAEKQHEPDSPPAKLKTRLKKLEEDFSTIVSGSKGAANNLDLDVLHDTMATVFCARAAAHTRSFGFYTDKNGERTHTIREEDDEPGKTLNHLFGISYLTHPLRKIVRPVISIRPIIGSFLDKCSNKVKTALFDRYTAYARYDGVWAAEIEVAPGTTIEDVEVAVTELAGTTGVPTTSHVQNAFPTITVDGDSAREAMKIRMVRDPSPRWPDEDTSAERYNDIAAMLAVTLGATALRIMTPSTGIYATIGVNEGYGENVATTPKYIREAQEDIARRLHGVPITISYVKSIAAYPKDIKNQPGVGDMWPEWLLTVTINEEAARQLTRQQIEGALFDICGKAGQQRFYVEYTNLDSKTTVTVAYAA